jgi:UDP-N-acetyl-D-mannosaminuronate dehydrogenase
MFNKDNTKIVIIGLGYVGLPLTVDFIFKIIETINCFYRVTIDTYVFKEIYKNPSSLCFLTYAQAVKFYNQYFSFCVLDFYYIGRVKIAQ